MYLLDKVHIASVKLGMVIMKLDKPGVHFASFGKPISSLSVVGELERAGVEFVYVLSNRTENQEERKSYSSANKIDNEYREDSKNLVASAGSTVKVFLSKGEETLDFQKLNIASDMLEEILDNTSSAYGSFFEKNGSTNDVNIEMMARVVYDAVSISRSTPEIFAKIISSEGASYDERIHSTYVCIHATMLAHALGIGGQEIYDISLAGLIHDIGLSRLPKNIIEPENTLTEYELNIYKKHPLLGEEICSAHPRVNDNVSRIVAMHHECMDGSGYPGRISAPYIVRGALIVGIAEAYNSMLMKTPDYVMHYNRKEIMGILYQSAGTKYPADMVQTFISIMGIYPVGSTVQLSNGKIGLVVGVNQHDQAFPKILMLDSANQRSAEYVDLSLHKDITIVRELNDLDLKINPMQVFLEYIHSKKVK